MSWPSHDDDDLPGIRCFHCPVCGSEPLLALALVTPWFCTSDRCLVLGWDPYSTLEENLTYAERVGVIDLDRKENSAE